MKDMEAQKQSGALPLAAQTTAAEFLQCGFSREARRDFDGAITDFSQALVLNPESADALTARGALRRVKGDLPGALADYDRAIAANPKHRVAYNNRGNARTARGGLAGALDDYNRDIELNPTNAPGYGGRGVVRSARGDYSGAVADFTKAIGFAKDDAPYPWLFRCLALRRLHRADRQSELSLAVTTWRNTWLKALGRYVTGEITEADLLVEAGSGPSRATHGRQCQADYYIGMGHLLQGEPADAHRFLEKCVATNEATYFEFALARAELDRLPPAR